MIQKSHKSVVTQVITRIVVVGNAATKLTHLAKPPKKINFYAKINYNYPKKQFFLPGENFSDNILYACLKEIS